MATPRLYGDELEDPNYFEDPAAVEEVVSRMVEGLRRVKTSLKIYAGEAYWAVFDHPRLLAALRELGNTGVKVQIVVGPTLSAGGSKGSPHIVDLAQEGLVEFYYRPTRGHHPHFRILDDEVAIVHGRQEALQQPLYVCVAAGCSVAIVQPHHEALQPLQLRETRHSHTRADDPEGFRQYMEEFERYTKAQNPVSNPGEQFVILRSSELRQIRSLAPKSYDDLNKSEIEDLLHEVHRRSELKKQKVIEATKLWERSATNR